MVVLVHQSISDKKCWELLQATLSLIENVLCKGFVGVIKRDILCLTSFLTVQMGLPNLQIFHNGNGDSGNRLLHGE